MPYLNPIANAVSDAITLYVTNPFYDEQRLQAHLHRLDPRSIFALSHNGSTLMHHTLDQKSEMPERIGVVVRLLTLQAMRIDESRRGLKRVGATAFLWTQSNRDGRSPYYQALLQHAHTSVIEVLVEQMNASVALRWISFANYSNIHSNRLNLEILAGGGYVNEFLRCLNDLRDASAYHWISSAQCHYLLESLLPIVLRADCAQTLHALFLSPLFNSNELLKRSKNKEETPIHALLVHSNRRLFELALVALVGAHDHKKIPSSFIKTLLLTSNKAGYRLLDAALHTGYYRHVSTILNIALIARIDTWMSAVEYRSLLVGHEKYNEGFSLLHIAICRADTETFLLYINTILQSIKTNGVSLDQFRGLLTHPNNRGYTPIHQIVHTPDFDTVPLFYTLFKSLFSPKEFKEWMHSGWVWCDKKHKDSDRINDFLCSQRRAMNQTSDTEPKGQNLVCLSSYVSAQFDEFVRLMNDVLEIERLQCGETRGSYTTIVKQPSRDSVLSCSFFSARAWMPLDETTASPTNGI